jgi:hypothetical protein
LRKRAQQSSMAMHVPPPGWTLVGFCGVVGRGIMVLKIPHDPLMDSVGFSLGPEPSP